MSQNTHNVRTRREQLSIYPESVCVGRYSGNTWQLELDSDDLDADRLVEGPVLYVRCDIAHRSQTEAEARGAAEQRRKDEEGQEPFAWLIQDKSKDKPGCAYSPDRAVTDKAHADKAAHFNNNVSPLYTRPANVAALEARVKELEAENAALKSKSSDPDDVTCALMDSQYVAGAKFGWNCGQDDDHDSLTKMIEGRLRDRIEAGVSFSKRSKDARAALTREGGV